MAAGICLMPVVLSAQWINVRTPGIPRTPDGKPDLSGLWRLAGSPYAFDLILDVKDETIFKPAAEALFRKRAAEYDGDSPNMRCLPLGPGDIFTAVFRIVQSPAMATLLYNGVVDGYRQVFLDGRELPKDPNPTWRGYSVGHWDGDTLVIDTAGFNDAGWLDQAGHPRSEKLHVTERFKRIDFGHMQFQITFDDPETLVRPLTISLPATYMPDTEMQESICNENERDRARISGSLSDRVKLSTETLAKFAGSYGPVVVSLVGDRLYYLDLPMFPQSETTFDSRAGLMEFSLDANGAVKSVTRFGALGDLQTLTRRRPNQ